MDERIDILKHLLEFTKPIDEIKTKLSVLGWDSKEELVRLMPAHAISVLQQFEVGNLTARDIQEWANIIEGRDDIGFESRKEDLLKSLIFELANPELTNQLTKNIARDWIKKLSE